MSILNPNDRSLERRNSIRLLGEKSVSILCTGKKLVYFDTSQNLEYALRSLAENQIQAAPILLIDKKDKILGIGKKKKNTNWIGFLSIFDLMKEVLKAFDEKKEWQNQLLNKTVGKLFEEKVSKSPFFTVNKTETIEEVLMLFGQGIHRVAVVDDYDNLLHVVTQSTIIKYIAEHNHYLGKLAELTPQDLGFLKKVITVNENIPTIQSFRTIAENNVTAVAVVNNEGTLVGNLSASDLKGLINFSDGKYDGKFFDPLRLPVMEFLHKIRQHNNKLKDFILTCKLDTKLKDVVQLLAREHIHRVFVVDENNKPCGVASLTDICSELFNESEEGLLQKRINSSGGSDGHISLP